MSRLSIVIPVWESLHRLEETLLSVLENRPARCEIIVVLNQRYDDPYDLTDEVCFVQAPSGAGLAESVNVGIAACESPVVHLLPAGSAVHEGWTDAALTWFEDPSIGAVAPLVVEMDRPNRVVEAGRTYSKWGRIRPVGRGRRPDGMAPPDGRFISPPLFGGFYRRSALDLVGMFCERVGKNAVALDMGLSFSHVGLRTIVEPSCRIQMSAYQSERASAFRQAVDAERFYRRWAACGRCRRPFLLHLLAIAAASLRYFPGPKMVSYWAGRSVGMLGTKAHRQHSQHLNRCRRMVQALDAELSDGGSPVERDQSARAWQDAA